MRRSTRVWLILSGLIPVLGFVTSRDTQLFIYTAFVFAYLLREPLARGFAQIRLPVGFKFWLLVLLSGWLTETLAWLGSYLKHAAHPALFHPQLIPDLILAIGFYGAWGLVWWLVLRRWRFSLGQVFVTTGLIGIGIEQNGAVLLVIIANLANPLAAAILALYVFVVYGAIMGIPYAIAEQSLVREGTRTSWLKYPVVVIGMVLGAKVLYLIVLLLASALHLIPTPQPIWTHPLY